MREVAEKGRCAHAIGDPLRFDQPCRRCRVPDVLQNYGAAQHQRGQHAKQIAQLVCERRRGEAHVTRRQAHPGCEWDDIGEHRVRRVHDALRLTGCAGGEDELHEVIRGGASVSPTRRRPVSGRESAA